MSRERHVVAATATVDGVRLQIPAGTRTQETMFLTWWDSCDPWELFDDSGRGVELDNIAFPAEIEVVSESWDEDGPRWRFVSQTGDPGIARGGAHMNEQGFLEVLDDLRLWVMGRDSMEGTLEYTWTDEPGTYRVKAFLRCGNSLGQGGARIISQHTEQNQGSNSRQ